MFNSKMPSKDELPSSKQLIRSTIIAIIVALVLLVAVVMPAEYAIDPTGAGRFLGLTEMGEIKAQLAEEVENERLAEIETQKEDPMSTIQADSRVVDKAVVDIAVAVADDVVESSAPAAVNVVENTAQASSSEPTWRDEVRVTLTPGEGTEFKLTMKQGSIARYSWVAQGGPVNFDTHGDGGGQSISYEKGRGVPEDEGELVAAFTGNHGWFFRNRNKQDVVLILRTSGDYAELKRRI